MHITSSLPNLIGGVSQQPELIRLPSHLKAQENGYCSPATGLSKRCGTIHLGGITSFTGTGFHATLDYATRGVFHLEVRPGTGVLKVVTDQGVEKPLYDSNGNPLGPIPYLTHANPAEVLRVVKEADTTFLLNTDVTVGKLTEAAELTTYRALVWVRAGNYGRTYSITVDGKGTASFTTPDGSVAAHINDTRTTAIAENLRTGLANIGVSCTRTGSVINITPDIDRTITVADGDGGTSLILVYKTLRGITDLPSSGAVNGFAVKVEGGDATNAGDYYLKYDEASRVYREVRSPWIAHDYANPDTLPLLMIPHLDGFMVKKANWTRRIVGDSETSADPSFIGKKINDLFFHQDRLGLISGENFDLSEQGSYYNFYRTTVRDLLDTDPISGAVTHPNVSTLRHAVPFNKRLLLFSAGAQFELTADGPLTPKSVATRALTEFQNSAKVRPLNIGSTLYFPADRGDYAAFYNYFVAGVDALENGVEISGHVPRYIPKGPTFMAASPVNNVILVHAPSEPANIYVYQFYQDGQERLQSAWHRWSLGSDAKVLNLSVVGSYAALILDRGGEVVSEAIDLSMPPGGQRLDRAFSVFPTGLSTESRDGSMWTDFTFPFNASSGEYQAVVTEGTERQPAGTVANVVVTGGTQGAIQGDFSGCTLRVGRKYRFAATLGRLMVREQMGGGVAGVSRGRTQIARAWVNYTASGPFSVEVGGPTRQTKTYRSTGRRLGTYTARVGEPAFGDGRFSFPVLGESGYVDITLVNETPFPSAFLSLDWEGYFVARGQNV